MGAPATPSGSRASTEPVPVSAASGFDPSRASIGSYVVRRRYSSWSWASFEVGRLVRLTAKQAVVKVYRDQRVPLGEIIAAFPEKEKADQLVQAINGVCGTYRQKVDAADAVYRERRAAAALQAERSAAHLIAIAMEARSGETACGLDPKDDSAAIAQSDQSND